jgi:hypothetical protein
VCRLMQAKRQQQHDKLKNPQDGLRSSHRKPDGSTPTRG